MKGRRLTQLAKGRRFKVSLSKTGTMGVGKAVVWLNLVNS